MGPGLARTRTTATWRRPLAAILKRLDGPMAIARVRDGGGVRRRGPLPDAVPAMTRRPSGCAWWVRRRRPDRQRDRLRSPRHRSLGRDPQHFPRNGLLVENLTEDTWAPGRDLERRDTAGWPDGRTDFVLDAMQRLDPMSLASRLPDEIRPSSSMPPQLTFLRTDALAQNPRRALRARAFGSVAS